LPHIINVLDAVDALRQAADDHHQTSRMVRVGTVNAGTVRLLTPTIRAFRDTHLSTQVEIVGAQEAGITADRDPGPRRDGNLYTSGRPLPATLIDAIDAARADDTIAEILGEDAVHDFIALAQLEWQAFVGSVSEWDRCRYLCSV
jgi:Glutamine synthetase, catalytic domain